MTPRSSPPRRLALLFPAALLGGIAAGFGLRLSGLGEDTARHPQAEAGERGAVKVPASGEGAGSGEGKGKEAGANSTAAPSAPFSMEKFRSAQGLAMHRMLAQVLPGADAAMVRALAEDLVKREPLGYNSPVWNAVMARWVALHAGEALAWARAADDATKNQAAAAASRPGKSDGRTAREASNGHPLTLTALKAWAAHDADGAIAAIQNANPEEWRAVLEILGDTDPGRALKLMSGISPLGGSQKNNPYIDSEDRLLAKWAAQDPQASLAYVMAKKPEDRDALLDKLAAGWALKDAGACGEWIATLDPEQKKTAVGGLSLAAKKNPAGVARLLSALPLDASIREAGQELVVAWAEKSPQEALAWLRGRFPEGSQRARPLAAVASTLMKTDLPAAIRIVDEMDWQPWSNEELGGTKVVSPGQKEDFIYFKADENLTFDPFSDSLGSPYSPGNVMRDLLERLGQENPALGLRCFEKAPAAAKELLLQGFAPAWIQHDPEAAMQWMASIPAAQVTAESLERIVKMIPELTPAAMRDWALRLPASALSEALAARSIADTPLGDPATTLAKLPFTDPASREAAAKIILAQWAESAPQEAAENMIAGPNPSPELLGSAVQNWIDRDPAAASAWTAALPAGLSRDAAIGGMIESLSNSDRDPDLPSALAWSLDLSDPAQRLKSATNLVSELALSAPESALPEIRETLHSASTLSDADRRALLELLPP